MKSFLLLASALLGSFAAPATEVPVADFAQETLHAIGESPAAITRTRLDRLIQRFPELRQSPVEEGANPDAWLPLTAVAQTAFAFAEFAECPELLEPALAFAEKQGDWNDIVYLTFYRLRTAEAHTAEALEALLARCEAASPMPEAAIAWLNLNIGLTPQVPVARRLKALREVLGEALPYAMVRRAAEERFALQATTFELSLPQLLPPVETTHRYCAENPRPLTCTLTAEDGAPVRRWTLEPTAPEGRLTLPALPEGHYVLTLESVGAYTQAPLRETHRFTVGRAAPFRLSTAPETFLVLDTLTGRPLPGATLTYRAGATTLGSGVSDAQGLLRFPTPKVPSNAWLRAEVAFQGHTASVKGAAWRNFDLAPLPQPMTPRLDLRLDRRLYRAGDTVRYLGYLADDRGRAFATQTTLTVTAYPPDADEEAPGRKIASIPLAIRANGLFAGQVQVPEDFRFGVMTFTVKPGLGTRAIVLPREGLPEPQRDRPSTSAYPDPDLSVPRPKIRCVSEAAPGGASQTPPGLTLQCTLPSAGKLRLFSWKAFLSLAAPLEHLVEERAVPAWASTQSFALPQGIYVARLYEDSKCAPVAQDLFAVGPVAAEDGEHGTELRRVLPGTDIPTEEASRSSRPVWLALRCDQGLLGLHPLASGKGTVPSAPALREGFGPVRLTLLENGLPHVCALPAYDYAVGNDFDLSAEAEGGTLTIRCAEPTARLAVLVRDAAAETLLSQAPSLWFPDAWGTAPRERLGLSRTEVPVRAFPLFGERELCLQESFVDTLSPEWPPEAEPPEAAPEPGEPLWLTHSAGLEERPRRLRNPWSEKLETSGSVATDPSVWGPSFPRMDTADFRDTLLWRTRLVPTQGRVTLPLPTLTAPAVVRILAIAPDGRSATWTGPLTP